MAQARIFYQQDCDINVLKGKRVALSVTVHRVTLMHSTLRRAVLTW